MLCVSARVAPLFLSFFGRLDTYVYTFLICHLYLLILKKTWKAAKVIPLHTGGDAHDLNNNHISEIVKTT